MDHTVHRFIPEDIALFSLLCDVPEKASVNIPSANIRNNDQGNRALTFERERDIVDNLAFIAAIDENPGKVIAVCIEEFQNASGLKVILAVNEGDLAKVQRGFVRVFGTLKDVPQVGKSSKHSREIRENLLKEVISLNSNRLLCRLRSTHARSSSLKRDRPPIDTNLAHLLRLNQIRRARPRDEHWIADSVMECERFQSLFRELEVADTTKVESILIDIVKCAHQLTTQFQLARVLNLLPHCEDFQPQARDSLLDRMQKVGRYHSACEFLFSAARRTTLFKNVEVEVIKLRMAAPTELKLPESVTRLEAILERAGINKPVDKNRLCQAVKQKERNQWLNFPRIEGIFEERIQDIRDSARVHAEIQIIYHYEENPPLICPRVICSSKDACFLCNLFARIHGKFHIERTHGRLHKKWRLPPMSALNLPQPAHGTLLAILQTFDDELKKAIRGFLRQPNREFYRIPNESTFVHPPALTPSVASEITNGDIIANSRSSAGSSTPTPTLKPEEEPGPPHREDTEPDADRGSQIEPEDHSDSSVTSHRQLVRGERVFHPLSRSGKSRYFEFPSLHIIAESFVPDVTEIEGNKPAGKAERGSMEIEWLSEGDEARIRNENIDVVNVETMGRGEEVTTTQGSLIALEGLYISFGRGIVYVRYLDGLSRVGI